MKCIAIDDEPLALELISGYIQKTPFLEFVAGFTNPFNAMNYLLKTPVDLLFIDINMPELSGIELLKTLPVLPKIIFTTAYSEYGAESYEFNAVDYLLKPVKYDRFLKGVNKAHENSNQSPANLSLDFIFVKTENRLEKINLSDILFIEGMRDYRRIHTIDKKIMTLQNFGELEQIMPSHLVCRVHKSYMVGINKIESIERNRIKISNQRIPISETYKELFFQVINNRI